MAGSERERERETVLQAPAPEQPQQGPAEPSSVGADASGGRLLGGAAEKTADSCSVDRAGSGREVPVPDAPNSSIQFQADWKVLSGNRTARSGYFKVVSSVQSMHCVCNFKV